MAILANRVKTRSNLFQIYKFITFYIRRWIVGILLLISLLLLFSPTKYLDSFTLELKGNLLSSTSLVYESSFYHLKILYDKFYHFKNLESENKKLKLEISVLKEENEKMRYLHSENIKLRDILNVTSDIEHSFITAKIVGTTITPFSSHLIIQSGSEDNVSLNDVARGKNGLIGRVIKVSDNYSTIMLVNDYNSRIPVISSDSKTRGILARKGKFMKVIHLDNKHKIKAGEKIYTSGDGKIYHKNIPVAIVEKVDDKNVFVKITENYRKLDFIIIETKNL